MALKELKNYLQSYPGFILIGYGREGKSSYSFLRKNYTGKRIIIADKNKQIEDELKSNQDKNLQVKTGENYLENIPEDHLILLSPGVRISGDLKDHPNLSSQTDLFLKFFRKQTIGITGTKGKSTTSSLTSHILKTAGLDQILLGNIGSPPFDHLDEIHNDTWIVFELSSHQLSTSRCSPAIAVLLNLYNEHLDHYDSAHQYFTAKTNIFLYQDKEDIIICNMDNPPVQKYLHSTPHKGRHYFFSVSGKEPDQGMYLNEHEILMKFNHQQESLLNISDIQLKGKHNLLNVMAAASCALMAGTAPEHIRKAVNTFRGLEHRLEYAGTHKGKHFFNDSIATVPEATIAAIKAIESVHTLILGGFDRGLDYDDLYREIQEVSPGNIIFTGDAGKRMYREAKEKCHNIRCYFEWDFRKAVEIAVALTPENGNCLLSPAAASYDQFKSFEERGRVYKELIKLLP